MKLLIITQAVDLNNPVLGFFHRWVEEFSKRCEKLIVICLEKGEYRLPANVKVLSLGKEEFIRSHSYYSHAIRRLVSLYRFYKYIWQERQNYNTVFVHMNPIYVVLGGLFWKLKNKKIGLWYTHRQVDLKLRLAEKFSDIIFTAAKESFNLKTDKLRVVGHGISVKDFEKPENIQRDLIYTIISVARITPIKNLDVLIEAANILRNKGLKFKVVLIGSPVNKKDIEYLNKLKKLVSDYQLDGIVKFIGNVSNNEVKEYYWGADLSINLAPTGGIDKAVLESMASSLLVLVANKAFVEYFSQYSDILLFKEKDLSDLAQKIINLMNNKNIHEIRSLLLKNIKEKSDLKKLITVLVNNLSI